MTKRSTLYSTIYFSYLVWTFIRYSLVAPKNIFWIVPVIRPLAYLIDPLFILIITGICIYHARIKRSLGWILWGSVLLLVISALSTIVNLGMIRPYNWLQFFIGYFRFIPFVIFTSILTNYYPVDVLIQKVIRISIIMIAISCFVNVLWFFKIPLLNNERAMIAGNKDWAVGLVENTHMFALVLSMFFVFYLHKILFSKKFTNKQILFAWLCLLFGLIQLAWAESKINILGIFLSLFISYGLCYGLKVNLKILIIPVVLVISVLFLLRKTYGESMLIRATSTDKTVFLKVVLASFDYNYKVRFVKDLLYEIPKEIPSEYLGAGPGVCASKFALDNPTKLSEKYFVKYTMANFGDFGNSVMSSPRTGYTAIYGDLGILGFFSYFGLYGILFFFATRGIRDLPKDERMEYFFWSTLTVCFLYNQVFVDSLYIGSPIFIIWSMGTLLIIKNHLNKTVEEESNVHAQ